MDDGEDSGLNLGIFGQDEPDRHGKGEHPLADAGLGKDLVDEVGCRFSHPSSAAGAAESTLLTGESDELLVLAVVTANSEKTMRKDSALEKGLELLGDMVGKVFSLGLSHRLKCAIVLCYGLVKNGLLGPSLSISSFSQRLEAELSVG